MILYQLRCAHGHSFESWFRNSAAFDALAGANALTCPECGTSDIQKAPMAPRIGRSSKASLEGHTDKSQTEAGQNTPSSSGTAGPGVVPESAPSSQVETQTSQSFETQAPVSQEQAAEQFATAVKTVAENHGVDAAKMMIARAVRRHVETTSVYVGPKLAEEARSQNRGESEERSIYGEATPEEAEELADEGIELQIVPWVPMEDA